MPAARWSLIVAILGSTMAFIDGTVVNVALPVIQTELRASVATMQWVIESYALLLASLVLVGGALGDRVGRRRVFSIGVILFAIASAACGVAPNSLILVIARGVQGVGAALLVPGSLALISAAYDEKARGKAIGTWSAASAITAAIGPVLGGWVVEHASWRWLFFFNVPFAAVVVVLAERRVEESKDDSAHERMDWPGALLTIVGLGLVVFALIDSAEAGGFARARVLVPLVLGVALLVVFVLVEARSSAPMVPVELFRSRTFAGTNVLTLFLYAALSGALFFVPFDLIQVQHYTPAEAGAALLPFVILISAMSPWAGGLIDSRGARLPLIVGPLIAALGFALLAIPGSGGSYWATFFPGMVVLGVGMGLTVAPLTTTVMGSVEVRHAGLASGINNAVARAAGLLAIAALGVVLVARFDSVLDAALARVPLDEAITRRVAEERGKLAAADLTFVGDPELQRTLRSAFDAAFIAGFRALSAVCAALAALSSLAAAFFIDRRPAS